jgi:hypothetical protein
LLQNEKKIIPKKLTVLPDDISYIAAQTELLIFLIVPFQKTKLNLEKNLFIIIKKKNLFIIFYKRKKKEKKKKKKLT